MKRLFARLGVAIITLMIFGMAGVAQAQYSSPNYKVEETFIGSGGELEACGVAFCARQSAGELTVGNTEGTNYQANAGFNTDNAERLEVIVNGGTFDLGLLDIGSTNATSTTFSVLSYISSGYVVRLDGEGPKNGNNNYLTAMDSRGPSVVGSEQFGVNLRANTSPPIGTNPQQEPDSSFSYGTYTGDYGVVDEFKFEVDDVIAQSTSSSGKTTYTLTMIANISTQTPAGYYAGSLVIVAIPTF